MEFDLGLVHMEVQICLCQTVSRPSTQSIPQSNRTSWEINSMVDLKMVDLESNKTNFDCMKETRFCLYLESWPVSNIRYINFI